MPITARLTILRDSAAGRPDETGPESETYGIANAFDAEVLALTQPLMQLAARHPADRGVAVRIDTADAVWLAEVEDCVAREDAFTIHVRVRHVLRDFETLARLTERFGGAAAKGTPVEI